MCIRDRIYCVCVCVLDKYKIENVVKIFYTCNEITVNYLYSGALHSKKLSVTKNLAGLLTVSTPNMSLKGQKMFTFETMVCKLLGLSPLSLLMLTS